MTDKPRFTFARFLPLLLLVAGFAAFFALGLQRYLSLDAFQQNHTALKEWVSAHQTEAVLAFVGLYIIATAFSLPVAAVLSIAGGFLFGIVYGTLWIIIGATVGASLLFLAAKTAL